MNLNMRIHERPSQISIRFSNNLVTIEVYITQGTWEWKEINKGLKHRLGPQQTAEILGTRTNSQITNKMI